MDEGRVAGFGSSGGEGGIETERWAADVTVDRQSRALWVSVNQCIVGGVESKAGVMFLMVVTWDSCELHERWPKL